MTVTEEEIAAAALASAEAELENAEAANRLSESAAAENLASAAATGVEAARAGAALAEANAAKIITENEQDLSWLREQATANSQKMELLEKNQNSLAEAIPKLGAELQASLATLIREKLISQQSNETTPETLEANPEKEAAQQEAEKQKLKNQKPERKHRWL